MFNFTTLIPNHVYRLLFIVSIVAFCASCNTSANEGFVWLGEPVVTDRLNDDGDPVDPKTKFDSATTTVYCHLTIRGPVGFKMFVRWYLDNQLLYEEFVDFGEARKASPNLTYNNGQPFPAGNYRCDYSAGGDDPSRSVEFTIED